MSRPVVEVLAVAALGFVCGTAADALTRAQVAAEARERARLQRIAEVRWIDWRVASSEFVSASIELMEAEFAGGGDR